MILETDRLLLRRPSVDDYEDYRALWPDELPEVAGVPALPASKPEDVWRRVLRNIGHWEVFGFGPFLVIERASSALVGEVGLLHMRREIAGARGGAGRFDAAPEATWKIARKLRGLGIAREAMTAAFAWFDAEHGPQRTVCMVHPANVPSLKLAARFGYRETARATYRDDPVILFERV